MQISNIIIATVVMVIILPLLAVLSIEWGSPSQGNTYNSSINFAYNSIANNKTGIFTNINRTIVNGTGFSNHLSNATAIIGFTLAFILPGFSNILLSLFQIPNLISHFFSGLETPLIATGLPQFANSGYLTQINNLLINVLILFMAFVGLSMWMKYPSWSATG